LITLWMPLLESEPQVVASVYAEDMMARERKQFFFPARIPLLICHSFLCAGSRPVQGSYFSILRDNACTIFINLRIYDGRSFGDISARCLLLKIPLVCRQSSDLRGTPAPLIRFLRLCTTFGFQCMFAIALQLCISIRTVRSVRCLDGIGYIAVFSNS